MGDQFSNFSDENQSRASLQNAIARLESGDFQQRWDAAKQLAKMGTAAIAPLIEILEDEDADPELRWFVVRTLGQFDSDAVVPALVRVLQAANTSEDTAENPLLEMAATALGNLGISAVDSLNSLLENQQLRPFATEALAQIRRPETILPLLGVVNDFNPKVRARAIEALGTFHDERVPPILIEALKDPSARVRKEAVIGLSRREDLITELNLVEQLRPLLWDIRPEVCQQAQLALSRLGGDEAAIALAEQIESETTPESVKLDAARSLCWIETPAAFDQLKRILFSIPNDPNNILSPFSIHQEIIRGLGRTNGPESKVEAGSILTEFLGSEHPALQNPKIKQTAALSLGQLGNVDAFDSLVQLLGDSEKTVQFHSIAALKQLNSAESSPSIYQKLQQLAQQNNLDPGLQKGILTALSEW